MNFFANSDKKRQTLIVLLIVSVITLVALIIFFGNKYINFKQDFTETTPKFTDTRPPSPSPTPPRDSQIFKELEDKIFTGVEPFEFSKEELEALNILLSLEINNPILESNEKLRIIREIYDDLKRLSDAYKHNKDGPHLATLSAEDIISLQNLSAKKVSCFQAIRKELEEKNSLNPKITTMILEPQIPQSLLGLKNKIFIETGPLDLTEEELENMVNLFLNLKDDDPLFQGKEKLLFIQDLSQDLRRAISAYKVINGNILNLRDLSPEAIKSFQNLSAIKVSCFQEIRDSLKSVSKSKSEINPKIPDLPLNENLNSVSLPARETKGRPIFDYKLDDSFMSVLSTHFPNFSSYYQILSRSSFNLRELLLAIPKAQKYSEANHPRSRRLAADAFEMMLFEKFFTISSFELQNNPCELFNLFEANFGFLLKFSRIHTLLSRNILYSTTTRTLSRFWDLDALTYSCCSFLKTFMDNYFLLDYFSDMDNSNSLKSTETFKVLFKLIEKFYNKIFSRTLASFPEFSFVRYEFPAFFRYWKFSYLQDNERKDLLSSSSELNFDYLKVRLLASIMRRKLSHGEISLVPLIYWTANFRHSQKLNVEFLASLSDARDVVLIMICCHVGLSLFEKEMLAKALYKEKNWFLHHNFFSVFNFIHYFLYNSIPLELFRSEDLIEWNVWNSHFYQVVRRLQDFNKPIFSNLLKQVVYLGKQQQSIHAVRISFEKELEESFKIVDLSSNLSIAKLPVIGPLERLKSKCHTENGIDYAEALKLKFNDEIPTWIIDMINNYTCFISTFTNNYMPSSHFNLSKNLSLISFQDMQAFQDSVGKSSPRGGVVDFFTSLNFFIELETSRLPLKKIQPPTSPEIDLDEKSLKRISPLATCFTNWNFDLECNRLASTTLSNKFGVSREAFVDRFKNYFNGIQVNGTPPDLVAVEYAKFEVSYSLKNEFWSERHDFVKAIHKLFLPLNINSWVNYWGFLVWECFKLVDVQSDLTRRFPQLKINVFAGVHLKAKFISGESELSAMKAFDNLFRLLERLVDSKPKDTIGSKEILQRVLFCSFLFCKTEFKEKNRIVSLVHDSNLYGDFYYNLRTSFSNYFYSKPKDFESSFANLFEKIRRRINYENLSIDPVQAMAFGREIQINAAADSISSYFMQVFVQMVPFRNVKEQDRSVLLDSKKNVLEILLNLAKTIPPQNTGLTISFGARYSISLMTRIDFQTHPMEPFFKNFFNRLDVAYKKGLDLEPIINNFVNTELQPLIPTE
jgi:hypothetical protein